MKILHPTDFSATAEKARALAIDLSERLKGSVRVVHVQENFENMGIHPYLLPTLDGLSPELLKRLEDERSEEVTRLRNRLSNLTPDGGTNELRWGKVLPELLEMMPDYDLMVMGAHGDNRLDAYFLGGIAGRLVRRSTVPVLTVRDEVESLTLNRVLVATDFGAASENTWAFCQKLAEGGVQLVLGNVIETNSVPVLPSETQAAIERLERFAKGASVRHIIRDGNPVDVLPEMAREVGADAIAIGFYQERRRMGLRFGSRADALLRHSSVPILSVPYLKE